MQESMQKVNNNKRRIALITGGSRGIGLGIARQLAVDGFDLAINGVREAGEVREVVTELEGLGARVIYCRGDVSSSTDRKKVIGEVEHHFGALHVLVNNAGVAPKERRDILEATEESFDHVVSTNLKSTYFLTQLAANWMIAGFSGMHHQHIIDLRDGGVC
jgi:3-oxoacyl-[acyl-carrier protein] reductase